jgi:hypothetical protein
MVRVDEDGIELCETTARVTVDQRTNQRIETMNKALDIVHEEPPHQDVDVIRTTLKHLRAKVVSSRLSLSGFEGYAQAVDYPIRYPEYVREFPVGKKLDAKAMQHFLSFELMDMNAGSVYMDVASSNSVTADIVQRLHSPARVWRQDLRYPSGVNGNLIGSDAADIPLPDESVDYMALHCSFEHFEDGSDIRFMREASRLLRSGGQVCIIPLYLATSYITLTSPSVWFCKYSDVVTLPRFDPRSTVSIMDSIQQRQQKYFDAHVLYVDIIRPLEERLDFEVHLFENHADHPGCPKFALLGTKRP